MLVTQVVDNLCITYSRSRREQYQYLDLIDFSPLSPYHLRGGET